MRTALKHEMLDIEHEGITYWTPNGQRFFIQKPKIEDNREPSSDFIRPHVKYTFTEVKAPRKLKRLRRTFRRRYGNPHFG